MEQLQLLQNFDRLAEAPNAVQRLRQFVLELAVRGKLVDRNSKDEPASELLKQIQAEKNKRTEDGKIRKQEPLPKVKSDEPWFGIPASWEWVRLGAITHIVMGQSPPGETYNKSGEGIPLINGPVEFTEGPFGRTVVNQYTTAPTNVCEEGDLLLCVRGSTTGRTNIAGFRACIGRGVAAIRPIFADDYIRLFVWRLRESIIAMGRGVAFPSVNKQQIELLPVPLPPIAEQRRIVEKVEELLALCDQLEARQTGAREHLTRLVRSALDHLTIAQGEEDFQKHSAFILQHSALILDTVPALRQAILSLAIHGHLVTRECRDVQTREIRFEEIIEDSRYGSAKKCHQQAEGTPVLRIPNVVSGKIDLSDLKRTELTAKEKADLSLKAGDLLIVRSNGSLSLVGRTAVVTEECAGSAFAGYLVRARLRLCEAHPEFVQLALSSTRVRQQIETPIRTTSGVKNINTQEIYRLTFPLPPLAEQHRIVAKVEELMRWCDELEARLDAAQTTATHLLDTTLHQLLMA